MKKYKKKSEKKKRNALWISVVIHSAFGCGETMISPHPLVIRDGMPARCRGLIKQMYLIVL
jgi:hypothetical protein